MMTYSAHSLNVSCFLVKRGRRYKVELNPIPWLPVSLELHAVAYALSVMRQTRNAHAAGI
jgi:hypothetical protein